MSYHAAPEHIQPVFEKKKSSLKVNLIPAFLLPRLSLSIGWLRACTKPGPSEWSSVWLHDACWAIWSRACPNGGYGGPESGNGTAKPWGSSRSRWTRWCCSWTNGYCRTHAFQPEPVTPTQGSDYGLQDAGTQSALAGPLADGRAREEAHARDAATAHAQHGPFCWPCRRARARTSSGQLQQTSW